MHITLIFHRFEQLMKLCLFMFSEPNYLHGGHWSVTIFDEFLTEQCHYVIDGGRDDYPSC